MMPLKSVTPVLFAILASGCASSMSGVGGTEQYGCRAPSGVQCTSVSGVYANTHHGAPRRSPQPPAVLDRSAPVTDHPAPRIARPRTTPTAASNAIRSNPRVLRVWIAPWEDSDGDLNEDAVVHVIVDAGRWLIEHVRPASRSRIDAVTPPIAGTPDTASPAEQATAPSTERLPRPPSAEATSASPLTGTR